RYGTAIRPWWTPLARVGRWRLGWHCQDSPGLFRDSVALSVTVPSGLELAMDQANLPAPDQYSVGGLGAAPLRTLGRFDRVAPILKGGRSWRAAHRATSFRSGRWRIAHLGVSSGA